MKFKDEVQKCFESVGWHEGRDMKSKFDKLKGFDKFPQFFKRFFI